jgi:glycine hydroxymethyltransferase
LMPCRVHGMSDILSLVSRHDEWRLRRCINLQCSENVTSEAVRKILSSDMGNRYTLPINDDVHGSFVENAYRGTRYIDEVEALGEDFARRVFGGKHATIKPLSGHVAAMIMLLATCSPGDRILTIDAKHGGYDGYLSENMAGMFGLKVGLLPFDESRWNVDSEAAARKIRSERPSLVVLGASFVLFPYDIPPLREAADDVGALIGYDGSHVLGLIAGGVFQKPLAEGVDILVGSTHKTFFGPQGGLIVCRDEDLFRKVEGSFYWKVMDNAHWNRIAALTQALSEARRHGARYASQVVKNSRALAAGLHERGLRLRFPGLGFTECHQIHVDEQALKADWGLTLDRYAKRLEKSNLIVDAVGRIGTSEVTRLGGEEKTMATIADLAIRALKGGDVAGKVAALRRRLRIGYC